jgi:hypothetical protein
MQFSKMHKEDYDRLISWGISFIAYSLLAFSGRHDEFAIPGAAVLHVAGWNIDSAHFFNLNPILKLITGILVTWPLLLRRSAWVSSLAVLLVALTALVCFQSSAIKGCVAGQLASSGLSSSMLCVALVVMYELRQWYKRQWWFDVILGCVSWAVAIMFLWSPVGFIVYLFPLPWVLPAICLAWLFWRYSRTQRMHSNK